MTELILHIDDMAYGGDGVARSDGKVFFVPGTIPGETVRAIEIKSSARFSRAFLAEVIKPSSCRIANSCPYNLNSSNAGTPSSYCPGCVYRHMEYGSEVTFKSRQLRDLMLRIASLDELPDFTAEQSPVPDRYRNKIVMHSDTGSLGYVAADKATVLDIPDCLLANPDISRRITEFRNSPAFHSSIGKYRHVTVRSTETDGAVLWCGNHIEKKYLTETTEAGPLLCHISSFNQVNPYVSSMLVRYVENLVSRLNPSVFVDIYCGTGLFAIAAAKAGVKSVLGIEVNRTAVECAERNAGRLCPGRAAFKCASASSSISRTLQSLKSTGSTLLFVDPPRRGLDPAVCKALQGSSPLGLIYVSCAPDTLARDLKALALSGYRIEEMRLLDMFPRTANFETAVLLRKKPL